MESGCHYTGWGVPFDLVEIGSALMESFRGSSAASKEGKNKRLGNDSPERSVHDAYTLARGAVVVMHRHPRFAIQMTFPCCFRIPNTSRLITVLLMVNITLPGCERRKNGAAASGFWEACGGVFEKDFTNQK